MSEFSTPFITVGKLRHLQPWIEIRDALIRRNELLAAVGDKTLWTGGTLPVLPAVKDLPHGITNYRDKITECISGSGPRFWRWNGTRLESYTIGTLLTDAGCGKSSWDPYGGTDLTPPSISHLELWDDIHKALGELSWVYAAFAWGPWGRGDYEEYVDEHSSWNSARSSAFSGLAPTVDVGPNAIWVGRHGYGRSRDDGTFTCRVRCKSSIEIDFATEPELATLDNGLTLVDAFIRFYSHAYWDLSTPLYVWDHWSDSGYDMYLNGNYIGSFNRIDTRYGSGYYDLHFSDAIDYILLDGSTNTIRIEMTNPLTTDPGVGDWPAPAFDTSNSWNDAIGPWQNWVYLKYTYSDP